MTIERVSVDSQPMESGSVTWFVDEAGEGFDVAIPAFSLDSPQARRVLN